MFKTVFSLQNMLGFLKDKVQLIDIQYYRCLANWTFSLLKSTLCEQFWQTSSLVIAMSFFFILHKDDITLLKSGMPFYIRITKLVVHIHAPILWKGM